ncbi:MAG: hypothetical protein ACLGGX_02495 [Bdellovibrionia bacterium]
MIAETILGLWLFQSMSQGGVELPSNPAWELRFEFREDGVNTLYYKRADEDGFCERNAVYEYAGEELIQQVTWVNPNNASWCGSDVDMQLGHTAKNKLVVKGNMMELYIPFPGEEVVYHWKKQ